MKHLVTNFMQTLCAALALSVAGTGVIHAQQAAEAEMPRLVEKDGRHALLVDGEPFLMLGGQSSNSSTWPKMLPGVWQVMEDMHANTLEIPIYWEQVEPQPGQYDFSMVQMVLDQARQHDMRLVLLWFATWKNGSNHYMPQWMKLDAKKYFNVMAKDGTYVDTPSPHCTAAMEADAKAFARFMGYLKEADPQHTVIMVQVQNEPGSWYSVRDYSKTAQKLFEQPVPEALLKPEVLKQLGIGGKPRGTWSEVFGEHADEYFHAWHVASYIEYVAAAGKAVNPLPMYVNVALRDPLADLKPNQYESGGATDNVIPIWKAAAPSIGLLAPDIYLTGDERVLKIIDLYARPDNALMVPETGTGHVKYMYEVIKQGIGYAPFGVDAAQKVENGLNDPTAAEYKLLAPMSRQLARWAFEGRIQSVIEPEDHAQQTIDLGQWEAIITFGSGRRNEAKTSGPANGKAMIITLGENEFMAVGTGCRFTFRGKGKNEGRPWQYLIVEEGYYEDGEFQMTRLLNGDQTDWGGPYIGAEPPLLRIKLVAR